MPTKLRYLLFIILLPACGEPTSTASYDASEAVDTGIYAAAVASESRIEADYARDANRRPAAVLEYFGVAPGMAVLDLFSGGGYFTELLSHVVGSEGRVSAHSNQAYLNYVGDEFDARHADGRLPNVDVLWAENNELDLVPDTYDAMFLSLTYHDIYHTDPQNGWLKIEGPKLLAELREGLRPGGIILIIDHVAETGSSRDTGNTLHRIDPGIVVEEMLAAGFELVGKSDILRNPDDDHNQSSFAPEVRGKTDRFVLKFRNPE